MLEPQANSISVDKEGRRTSSMSIMSTFLILFSLYLFLPNEWHLSLFDCCAISRYTQYYSSYQPACAFAHTYIWECHRQFSLILKLLGSFLKAQHYSFLQFRERCMLILYVQSLNFYVQQMLSRHTYNFFIFFRFWCKINASALRFYAYFNFVKKFF